jgi:hypothetical protein
MFFSRLQRSFYALILMICVVLIGHNFAQAETPFIMASVAITRSATPAFEFTPEDEQLLDEVERGCFNYLWNEVGKEGKLAKDRMSAEVASLAGIGFQLSALPIGVERGWITREQAEARALKVLRTLRASKNNRRSGVFLHFVNAETGDLSPHYDNEISTVDHSLFLAGAIPAATFFGGEVAEIVNKFCAETNWREFRPTGSELLSFAWKPTENSDVSGTGSLMDLQWRIASDEERLIYFMAAGSPTDEHAIGPRAYYLLERQIGHFEETQPYVLSWNGALFTYFFSHCWINYREMQADDPAQFGVNAPRVDWYENSRRAWNAHRQACIRFSDKFKTFSENRWGLSPCMGQSSGSTGWNYLVQDVQPNLSNQDQVHDGTLAPYAAASAIMFTPVESLAALRAFRELITDDGKPMAWRDPAEGGYGFVDSFNLDQKVACDENMAINVGPMLLAIENARTGLIWKLFMQHEHAQRSSERLRLSMTN